MAGGGLLAAAAWLRWLEVPYLALAAVATAAAVWRIVRGRGSQATLAWQGAFVLALGAFCAFAVGPQRQLSRLDTAWPAYEGRALEAAAARLDLALGAAAADVRRMAEAALEAPGGLEGFAALADLVGAEEERAVVLFEGGAPAAWAGTLRVPIEAAPPALGVVRTPFYDALTYVASRGGRRAVATVLVQARPPASGLATSLAEVVVAKTDASGIRIALVDEAPEAADAALRLTDGRFLLATLDPLVADEVRFRTMESAQVRGVALLVVAAVALLGATWITTGALVPRLATIGLVLAAVAIAPLNALTNVSPVFDPSYFFVPAGRWFTASAGALAITAALLLLALLTTLRARPRTVGRPAAGVVVAVVAALGPFLLRDLARGISAPASGAPPGLWLAWHVALFLAATVLLLVGASAGRLALGARRGLPPLLAPAIAAIAALGAQPLLAVPGGWPDWYLLLWIAAIASLALTRRTRGLVLVAAAVASLGSMTLVWGNSVRWRAQLAQADLEGLGRVDEVVATVLDLFAESLAGAPLPTTRAELLAAYARSNLPAANQAVQLTSWGPTGVRLAEVTDLAGGATLAELRSLADSARARGDVVRDAIETPRGVRIAVAVPDSAGRVTTVAVARRTRLLPDDPYAPLLAASTTAPVEPPYVLSALDARPGTVTAAGDAAITTGARGDTTRWTRVGNVIHGDWVGRLAGERATVHVEIGLSSTWALVQRGTLLLLLDLVVVGALVALGTLASRGMPRWLRVRRRRWMRSYRLQLTVALLGFFALPALAFGLWASRQLREDYRSARELLVFEALRLAARWMPPSAGAAPTAEATAAAGAVGNDAPLLVYRDGMLAAASDDLLATLAPLGRLLPTDVVRALEDGGREEASRLAQVGPAQVLVGYREVPAVGRRIVLAVPARASAQGLDARRRDLGILVLFAMSIGALGALALSGVAGRQLARPIGALREAALRIAAGEREPALVGPEPPAEFVPVFSAFRRMAADLAASREALEAAERRTATVLRNTASAVVAVDAGGRVALFNPAASRLFGSRLAGGVPLARLGVPELDLAARRAIDGDAGDGVLELEIGVRQVQARVAPLRQAGGAVLTLDDVTELARAQRVLAWGEMARQVAHEIKNPLTPIRLGVQHLRRAYQSGRGDYAALLEQNVERILAEIDRLDQTARAFSRYGTARENGASAEPTDVAAVARDVVELERLGAGDAHPEGAIAWRLEGAEEPCPALARPDELREVLLNVLENARLAGARTVRVRVRRADDRVDIDVEDDGGGVAPAVLPRVFEPHFSTRTSGSGLGLAVSRRLVEGWGGAMTLESVEGVGTTVRVTLAAVPA